MDQKIWDNLTVDSNSSVEDHENPLIVNYFKKFFDILTALCEIMCKLHNNCLIIDMGEGYNFRNVFVVEIFETFNHV